MKLPLLLFLFLPFSLLSQPIQVTGTVTDTDGTPLIGASVYSIIDHHGTVTDGEGAFSLRVELGTELTFSYVGYNEENIFLKSAEKAPLAIQLSPGLNLPAVIVIAYPNNMIQCRSSCPSSRPTGSRRFGIAPDPQVNLTPLQAATVFPNPFVSQLQVTITPEEPTQLSAVLLDIAGREARRWPARQLAPGASLLTYRMGTTRLVPGLYLLRLTDQDGRTEVRKVHKAPEW